MVLGNDNKDQSSEKQLEAGQALDVVDHQNELGYNKVCILLLLQDGMRTAKDNHVITSFQDPKNSLTLFSNFAIAYSCCSVLSGITPVRLIKEKMHMLCIHDYNPSFIYSYGAMLWSMAVVYV